MIATDGVFSMDGYLANLPDITALAKKYEALVMVDDCHSTGVIGQGGRGTASHFGVDSGVDIITGTLGKALGRWVHSRFQTGNRPAPTARTPISVLQCTASQCSCCWY